MSKFNKTKNLIQVNSSSIIDLKTELYRKQEQLKLLKQSAGNSNENNDNSEEFNHQKLPKKLLEIVQQSSKPVNSKKPKLNNDKADDENNEEELALLQKSRETLEKKAKLYEQISNGQVKIDSDDENMLVDFDKQHVYEDDSRDDSNDKIEYIDQFGRTKLVTAEEYERLQKEREEYESRDVKNESNDSYDESNSDSESKSTSKASYQQNISGDIHYQHVRDGEIRDHGVGFYSFSENESERKKQIEMLDQLRKETESIKQEKNRIKNKRKQMLRDRLAKIAARKGIALPPAASNDNHSNDPSDDEDSDDNHDNSSKMIRIEKATIQLPESKGPREWDLGKKGVVDPRDSIQLRKSSKYYSTEKYKAKLREQRNEEFAPPKIYHNNSSQSNACPRGQRHQQQQQEPDMLKFLTEKISEIRRKNS